MELYAEPAVHLPVRQQRAQGHGAGVRILLRVYAAVHAAGELSGGRAALERISGDSHQYGCQLRAGVPLRPVRGVPGFSGYEQRGEEERKSGVTGRGARRWNGMT